MKIIKQIGGKYMNVPIDISQVTLKTDRLILRPWKLSDIEDFYEYAQVDGVGQMAGWAPHESIEKSRGILERFISEKKVFALEHDGKVIGSLGIERYNEDEFPEFAQLKCREIGYVLSKDYWGRGLMPEAVGEVIRYLFEDLGLTLSSADILSEIVSLQEFRKSADSSTIPL